MSAKNKCESCGTNITRLMNYCPECGDEQIWEDQRGNDECYYCGTEVHSKFNFCYACGEDIEPEGWNDPVQRVKGFSLGWGCDYECGGNVQEFMSYCPWCGEWQSWDEFYSEYECEECGSNVSEEWWYCVFCGDELDWDLEGEEYQNGNGEYSNKKAIALNEVKYFTASAAGAAVVPIPVADVVAISSIQVAMVMRLGNIYGKTFNPETFKGIFSVLLAASAGTFLASLVKAIPGLGWVVGGVMQMLIASGITYALGLSFIYLLENNREINKESIKKSFNKFKSEGKEYAIKNKGKIKRLRKLMKQVNFHSDSKIFNNKLKLYYNITDEQKSKLRIFNSNGDLQYEVSLDPLSNEIDIDTRAFKGNSQYIANLEINGELPITILLEKK